MARKHRAIPTVYQGYEMRSRLEARWAVFFDHIGLEWQYEPQHYSVEWQGNTVNYLPDFYLPTLKAYAEVKGGGFTDVDVTKVFGLSKLMRAPVLLLEDVPNPYAFGLMVPSFRCVVDPYTKEEDYTPIEDLAVLSCCYSCGYSCRNGGQWDLLYSRCCDWGFHCQQGDKYTEFQTSYETLLLSGNRVIVYVGGDYTGQSALASVQYQAFNTARNARF